MKRFISLALIFIAVSSITVWAEQPADISTLSKEQKQLAELQLKLEKDNEKLAKLSQEKEALIAKRNRKHHEAVSAADKNTQTAKSLSKDIDSKSKAKKAAKETDSKAKSSRKADSRVVEKNEQQIKKLEKSIQKNEAKLRKLETKLTGN